MKIDRSFVMNMVKENDTTLDHPLSKNTCAPDSASLVVAEGVDSPLRFGTA